MATRTLVVAGSVDAMVPDRPYRNGMPPWEAPEEIVRNSWKQFDPEVGAFKHVVSATLEKV